MNMSIENCHSFDSTYNLNPTPSSPSRPIILGVLIVLVIPHSSSADSSISRPLKMPFFRCRAALDVSVRSSTSISACPQATRAGHKFQSLCHSYSSTSCLPFAESCVLLDANLIVYGALQTNIIHSNRLSQAFMSEE